MDSLEDDRRDPGEAERLPVLGCGNGIARMISAGISAKPTVKSTMLPISAAAPPVSGSRGPGSISYSLGRYLWHD